MNKNHRLCLLIILDGWGINESFGRNAVSSAHTPFLKGLFSSYPHTRLMCSGEAVGLPEGFMGNSEVGHLNLGAGRVVFQDLLRINNAIKDGSFFNNRIFSSIMDSVKARKATLHLMGLVSDGGVHSHLSHLMALIEMACEKEVSVCVHAILDGRDTPPDSALGYLKSLQNFLAPYPSAHIGSVCGRFYAMDRDTRWDRTRQAYVLYTEGVGRTAPDPLTAVKNAYQQDETDEFVSPTAIVDERGNPIGTVSDNDGLIFFNFRADRARQLIRAFTEEPFSDFDRKVLPAFCNLATMTLYDKTFGVSVAFPQETVSQTLGETVSQAGLKQLRIAETEKYAHVTYFFNGGAETPFPGEERVLIPSPRDVRTYDKKPEMSALEVTKTLIEQIKRQAHELIIVNYANLDMVGHTGVFDATVKACETVDSCLSRVVPVVTGLGGVVLITADHGNAEQMTDSNGSPHTAHTQNPVPLILVDDSRREAFLSTGRLGDVAPTVLTLLRLVQPAEMSGRTLLQSP